MSFSSFVKYKHLFLTNFKVKMCDTSNIKKALDKSPRRSYNGIVNSKGAADKISVALFFWFIALIPYTKGCMKSQDFCTPLIFFAVTYQGGNLYGLSDNFTTGSGRN